MFILDDFLNLFLNMALLNELSFGLIAALMFL